MKDKYRGKMIVLEGLDKSGKTTQSRLLFDYLNVKNKNTVKLLEFPDYTTRIGNEIRLFLDGQVDYSKEIIHMLLSANRWEKKNLIEELLKNNYTIILNRYYHSNFAYGLAHDLDLDWLINLDKGLPKEDVTIVLDIDPHISFKRGLDNNFTLDEFERNKLFLQRARENYLLLADKFKWYIINSATSKEIIFNKIISIIGE